MKTTSTPARPMTRRGFLQRSLAVSSVFAVPLVVPGRVLGRDGGVAPSNRIALGGIGIGPRGKQVLVTYNAGMFHAVGEAELSAQAKVCRQGAMHAFLRRLEVFRRGKEKVSSKTGKNYAPAKFANHPEGKGYTSAEYALAMLDLAAGDHIIKLETGYKSKPVEHLEIGPVPVPEEEADLSI